MCLPAQRPVGRVGISPRMRLHRAPTTIMTTRLPTRIGEGYSGIGSRTSSGGAGTRYRHSSVGIDEAGRLILQGGYVKFRWRSRRHMRNTPVAVGGGHVTNRGTQIEECGNKRARYVREPRANRGRQRTTVDRQKGSSTHISW
jgi:hypothetical protein